jgi:hypothetical protein
VSETSIAELQLQASKWLEKRIVGLTWTLAFVAHDVRLNAPSALHLHSTIRGMSVVAMLHSGCGIVDSLLSYTQLIEQTITLTSPGTCPTSQQCKSSYYDSFCYLSEHSQVGSFELKVRRSTATGAAAAGPMAAPAAAVAPAAPAAPYTAPQTLVITKAPPMDSLLSMGESVDEALVHITSPKVWGEGAGAGPLGWLTTSCCTLFVLSMVFVTVVSG